jgi:acetyl-CoA C-acetyltransferase
MEMLIAGSAVVPCREYARPEEDLAMHVIAAAVRDAGLDRTDVHGIVGMRPRDQATQQYQAQHIADRMGLAISEVAEVEIAALGMTSALRLGAAMLEGRHVDAVVVYGAHRDSRTSTADWYEGRAMRTSDASFVGAYGMAPIVWNALAAREMIAAGEVGLEKFVEVAVRLRSQGVANPDALLRTPVTAEEVASSRMIADPLRRLMVCPRGDGAGAFVLVRQDRSNIDRSRAVSYMGGGVAHDGVNIVSEVAGTSFWKLPALTEAAKRAWEHTAIGPDDVDFFEPWAPFAPMEVMVMRALGFRNDQLDKLAVSPSGGLIARGHPLLATAFYSVHEIVTQLRNEAGSRQVEGARFGAATWESGNYNGAAVDVFGQL